MKALMAFTSLILVAVVYIIVIMLFSNPRFEPARETPDLPPPHGLQEAMTEEPEEALPGEMPRETSSAPHYTYTRIPHPERKMTDDELIAWIALYDELGGINAQELELYKIINEIRAEHGLPPFILCPRLSKASRLFSYLQVKYHTVGHTDRYYGDMMARSNLFGAYGRLYMENANSQQWYVMPDGRIEYVYLSPQQLVDGWMDSPDHRDHILTIETTHAGFGVDSGINRVVPTMKTLMPR